MKKNTTTIIVSIIGILILIGAGYAIFHKSSKSTASTNSTVSSSTPAVNNAVVVTKTNSTIGQYLATPSNMALYTYGSDTSGVSNCTGECLAAWPAYVDSGATTGLPTGISTITRTDNGQVQYTYNGLPLYTFASDSPGQVTGNGVSGFSVATPAAASSSQPSSSSSSSSSNSSANSPY